MKISVLQWCGYRRQRLAGTTAAERLTALYLMTNARANAIGIYPMRVEYIAADLDMPMAQAKAALVKLCDIDFCSYEILAGYIWVHDMAFEQFGSQLRPSDNQVKGIQHDVQSLPYLGFLDAFYDRYQTAFHLKRWQPTSAASGARVPSLLLFSETADQLLCGHQWITQCTPPEQSWFTNSLTTAQAVNQKEKH